MKSVEELWGLLEEARQLPYGAAQIALVEQVMRHADASGERELAYASRIVATNAYVYGGEPATSFVTFAWLLADYDREPAPFHGRFRHRLLWYFKYMVSTLTRFPEVPLARAYAVLDDMERRYLDNGHSLQAVHKYRFLVARHVGDHDAAAGWYERWLTTPRDDLSDCAGCDPSSQVHHLVELGRDDEAIALAEPVLAGRLACSEQPQGILNGLLTAYLRTGRTDAAADAHRRAYRLIRGNLADLWDIGDHVAFCARTGNEHRGLEILQRHIDWLDRAPSPASGMAFAASSALLLRRLTATGHGGLTVRRREHGDRPATDVPAAELAEELAAYATALSLRFDARNGTTEQSRLIAETLAAEPYPVELPLSASAGRAAPAAPRPVQVTVPEPPAAEIPDDAGPEALLDLADEYERADTRAAVAAVLAAFDARFPDVRAPGVAGRRGEFRGDERWRARDLRGAMAEWRAAAAHYADAGDEGRAHRVLGAWGVASCMAGAVDEGVAAVTADLAYQRQHGGARRRAVAWARQALVLAITGRPEESLGAMDEADAVVAELGDERMAARSAHRRAHTLVNLHRHAEAAAAAERAMAFYRAHGPADLFASAALLFARSVPDRSAAVAAADEVLATGDVDVVLDARLTRARAHMALDRPGDAVADFVEAVAICAEQGIEDGGAAIRHELAVAYRDAGRLAAAAEVAEEAVAGWVRLGDEPAADDSRFVLAGVYGQLGDTDPALALYDELIGRLTANGNDAGRAQVLEQAAELLFRADRDAEAAERFGAAAQAYAAAGGLPDELRVLRRRFSVLHWADEVAAAEETLALASARHDALPAELAAEPGMVWERVVLGFEAGRMLMSRGRYAEALPYVEGASQRLRAIGRTDDADRLAGMAGEVLLRSGRPGEAVALLADTLASMGPEASSRAVAARVLAEALDELGRDAEAAAVREEYGLEH